eukprot:Amastigsp_a845865_6.p1 type:complete len:312 gc:universal Amastigsp_a845865_6:980-45(-)
MDEFEFLDELNDLDFSWCLTQHTEIAALEHETEAARQDSARNDEFNEKAARLMRLPRAELATLAPKCRTDRKCVLVMEILRSEYPEQVRIVGENEKAIVAGAAGVLSASVVRRLVKPHTDIAVMGAQVDRKAGVGLRQLPARVGRKEATRARLQELGVDPSMASLCVLKSIVVGHVSLDGDAPLEQIVARGKCRRCYASVSATLREALAQGDCGGPGAVKCGTPGCDGDALCASLCEGLGELESIRDFHHCVRCRRMGKCIGYKEQTHCEHCHRHFLNSSSGCVCFAARGIQAQWFAPSGPAADVQSRDSM